MQFSKSMDLKIIFWVETSVLYLLEVFQCCLIIQKFCFFNMERRFKFSLFWTLNCCLKQGLALKIFWALLQNIIWFLSCQVLDHEFLHHLEYSYRSSIFIIPFFFPLFPQRYTQSNGRRPFGISALIVGFDFDGTPRLYQTDPSGTYHAWKVSWPIRFCEDENEGALKSYK